MKFYRKAESAAKAILSAFQTGAVPKAMAPVFIHRKDNVPCRSWSWNNQLLAALFGNGDARGYRQWQEVGRHVKKGEKSFAILVPLIGKRKGEDPQTGQEEERSFLYGFTSARFSASIRPKATRCPHLTPRLRNGWKTCLWSTWPKSGAYPLMPTTGRPGAALGRYRASQGIALGVENLSTWAHEMCHAADDHLGNLKERGQHWRSETVAELGGAILLEVLGHDVESDRGGCWNYVKAYADDVGVEPIAACQRVLKRTCDAVALILDSAESLRQVGAAKPESASEAVA